MNLKRIIAAGILLMSLAACVEERSNKSGIAPGWVAFDYTAELIERSGTAMEYLRRFNCYLEQTSQTGRDSVDRLYFSRVKILCAYTSPPTWTLNLRERYGNERTITVYNAERALGHAVGGTWTVVCEGLGTKYGRPTDRSVDTFHISTRGDGAWVVKHIGRDREFTDASTWTVRFDHSGAIQLEGSGTRTSIAKPALHLAYTIESPLLYRPNPARDTYNLGDGLLRIVATGDNRTPEESTVKALGNEYVQIYYGRWQDKAMRRSAIEL